MGKDGWVLGLYPCSYNLLRGKCVIFVLIWHANRAIFCCIKAKVNGIHLKRDQIALFISNVRFIKYIKAWLNFTQIMEKPLKLGKEAFMTCNHTKTSS